MADCKNCYRDWLKCKQNFLEGSVKKLRTYRGYENITIDDLREDAFESLYFNAECVDFKPRREIDLIGFDDLQDKNLLVMGAPFAGKSVLIQELERFGHVVYGMGQYCREHLPQTEDTKGNPTALTLNMLKKAYDTFDLKQKFIIDNPIKNMKQFPILFYLKVEYTILNVERNLDLDLNSRGRADDIYLQDKIKYYNENMPQVLNRIKKLGLPFITVENNGNNFTCKDCV
jgi:hypothetical protein